MISAVLRLRLKPWVPVEQNVQLSAAADLARHAQRAAALVGDEHRLDGVAAIHAEQPLVRAVGGGLFEDDLGTRTSACCSSLARSSLPRSVISLKSVTWRWYIHFITWWARKRFSPSLSAKKCSSPARSRSSRLVLATTSVTCPGRALGSARAEFGGREEIGGFDGRVLQAVRTVHGIGVDAFERNRRGWCPAAASFGLVAPIRSRLLATRRSRLPAPGSSPGPRS